MRNSMIALRVPLIVRVADHACTGAAAELGCNAGDPFCVRHGVGAKSFEGTFMLVVEQRAMQAERTRFR